MKAVDGEEKMGKLAGKEKLRQNIGGGGDVFWHGVTPKEAVIS